MKKTKKEPTSTKEKAPRKRILRVPRPMGITQLCQERNQAIEKGESDLIPHNTIKKRYINALLNNQLLQYDTIQKIYKPIGIDKIAMILKVTEYEVMVGLSKEMAKVGNLFDRQKTDLARALSLRLIFWGSEISALTDQQLAILMASQGGKYRPFISSEVNKAIANKIASAKPMLDLLKLMTDKQSGTLALTNPQQPTGTDNGTLMTIEMAHNMFNNRGLTVMNDEATRNDILLHDNALKLLPETNPNYQGGDILRGQSLTQGMPEDLNPLPKTDKSQRLRGIEDIEDSDDFRA